MSIIRQINDILPADHKLNTKSFWLIIFIWFFFIIGGGAFVLFMHTNNLITGRGEWHYTTRVVLGALMLPAAALALTFLVSMVKVIFKEENEC